MPYRESAIGVALLMSVITGCSVAPIGDGDGPVAENISGPMGDPIPSATDEQLATFARGKAVFQRRFDLAEGLGPTINVAFCGGCHERPTPGGSAGLYRNFFLAGAVDGNGDFEFVSGGGAESGAIRVFNYGPSDNARPTIPPTANVFAQRNPIPMFGAGLIVEISDDEILSRADEADADGDGISGRPNYENGAVGRFGRKAQTASIEGFTRGPLFNHVGITTRPLSETQRAALPMHASESGVARPIAGPPAPAKLGPHMQISAPDTTNRDFDGVSDPELSDDDLFDLVSFVMLLGAPELDALTTQSESGRLLFHQIGCGACHVPRIEGPRGPLPVYSDLLLHDMGDALADGIVMGDASGSEFRTQPLWGLAAVGPYLHDGRAETINAAILAHGGEAEASRDAFEALSSSQRTAIETFLRSLGGLDQYSTGLVEPDAPIPSSGEAGGPLTALSSSETARFESGREVFDRDFGNAAGIGAMTGTDEAPRFNGDSCRACHFDPVIGGAGPRGVNVMRHGVVASDGTFSAPPTTPNTILHKQVVVGGDPPTASSTVNVFEQRQTPTTLGAGLIDSISEATILANEDPDDADGDGISGRANVLPGDGRIGRFGWKADVPSLAEFVRDASAAEVGLTLPAQSELTFGLTEDTDEIADPEMPLAEAEDLAFFMTMLAPPPRQSSDDPDAVDIGEVIFDQIGCSKCHIPMLTGTLGEAPLYSDLLLHDILAAGSKGIESGDATQTEFRTAPLWGLSQTAPYFHTGAADTIEEAIRLHAGEATSIRDAYESLEQIDRDALLAFLGSL